MQGFVDVVHEDGRAARVHARALDYYRERGWDLVPTEEDTSDDTHNDDLDQGDPVAEDDDQGEAAATEGQQDSEADDTDRLVAGDVPELT